MVKLQPKIMSDLERVIELNLVRATEQAALTASKWIRKGDKNAADLAASGAIRGMFALIPCRGEGVVGEGLKDEAPGLFLGEQLGTWDVDSVPRDEAEKRKLIQDGHEEELDKVFHDEDLAGGADVIFCATGISDSPLLPGVRFVGHTAETHSILLRAKTGTVQHIGAAHGLTTKTIHLRSTQGEQAL